MSDNLDQSVKPVARLGVKDGEIAYFVHVLDFRNGRLIRSRETVNEDNRRLLEEGNNIALMEERGQEALYEIAYASPLLQDLKNPSEEFIIVFIKFDNKTQ